MTRLTRHSGDVEKDSFRYPEQGLGCAGFYSLLVRSNGFSSSAVASLRSMAYGHGHRGIYKVAEKCSRRTGSVRELIRGLLLQSRCKKAILLYSVMRVPATIAGYESMLSSVGVPELEQLLFVAVCNFVLEVLPSRGRLALVLSYANSAFEKSIWRISISVVCALELECPNLTIATPFPHHQPPTTQAYPPLPQPYRTRTG